MGQTLVAVHVFRMDPLRLNFEYNNLYTQK